MRSGHFCTIRVLELGFCPARSYAISRDLTYGGHRGGTSRARRHRCLNVVVSSTAKPIEAMQRELSEEVGVSWSDVESIAEYNERLAYELPKRLWGLRMSNLSLRNRDHSYRRGNPGVECH